MKILHFEGGRRGWKGENGCTVEVTGFRAVAAEATALHASCISDFMNISYSEKVSKTPYASNRYLSDETYAQNFLARAVLRVTCTRAVQEN